MSQDRAIFHITHVDNLSGIIAEGGLWCDRQRIARGLVSTNIGYLHIKARRLDRAVTTRAGGTLGDYVPFNFCPRSVMLYVINRGHQDYADGQTNVVHLVSSVSMAVGLGRPWAFTDRHAELGHALHFDDLFWLNGLPWRAIEATSWREVKEEKQAEFLVHDFFPWLAITEIGVMTPSVANLVTIVLANAPHKPAVKIRPEWYY